MMKEKIIELFAKHAKNDRFVFIPQIKVKRTNDILYLSEMRKTETGYLVMTEVGTSDKAPVPLGMLDDLSLKAIYYRLQGAKVLEIERIK